MTGSNTLWLKVKRNISPDTELVMILAPLSRQREKCSSTTPVETQASPASRETPPPAPAADGSSALAAMKVEAEDSEEVLVKPKERRIPSRSTADAELPQRKSTFCE